MLTRVKSFFALALLWALALSAQRTQPLAAHRITGRVDLIRISAQASSMTVSELFLLDQDTFGADKNSVFPFTIFIPSAANIRECIVENYEGEPVKVSLSPGESPGEYVIKLPYHPGGTKAQVIYELAYSGLIDFEARPSVTQETLAVMLPKSMRFESATRDFEAVKSDQSVNVYVVKKTKASQRFKFKVQGYGDLAKNPEPSKAEAQSVSTGTETTKKSFQFARTVGVLIAFALIVGIGITIWWRTRATAKAQLEPTLQDPASLLREKLLELETARLKGEISSEAYQKRQADIRSSIKRLNKS